MDRWQRYDWFKGNDSEAAGIPIGERKKRPMPFLAYYYGFRTFVGCSGHTASRSLLKAKVKR